AVHRDLHSFPTRRSSDLTLYFLLIGNPPFSESDAGQILQEVVERPFYSARQRNPRVPRALEAICSKAMRLKPEDRYPSAGALARSEEHTSELQSLRHLVC